MQCVANFEIKAELSVFEDDRWLTFEHPRGLFKARIQNIVRKDFSTPFLLSLHLTFDTPNMDEAAELAEERLADCLNILSFATGCSFARHRIRQIVDCTAGLTMRSCRVWADSLAYEDPEPFLDPAIKASINELLTFDPPPAVQRAMRWYRLGIHAANADDQFQYFWFALELIAVAQKSSRKVPTPCPHCKRPLYCENCKVYPHHRPYEKEAIRALMKAVDKDCDDATVERLEKIRNSLMHGATLRELGELEKMEGHMVDRLGQLVFRAIIHQFPRESLERELVLGAPSTYVHRKLTGVAHIETVVPLDKDGKLDLNRFGVKSELVVDGPPQSARPSLMSMTLSHYKRLSELRHKKGDHQEMCARVHRRAKVDGEKVFTMVLSTDMARILDAVRRGDQGEWQDLFREIIVDAKPPPPENISES